MADESITQNEGGYELLAVLVFILGTPLGLLLYEKGAKPNISELKALSSHQFSPNGGLS